MMQRDLKNIESKWLLLPVAFLAGISCASCSKGGCVLAGDYNDWDRELTSSDTSFQAYLSSAFPLDTSKKNPVEVYTNLYNDTSYVALDSAGAQLPPQVIYLNFRTHYDTTAIRAWKDAGLFSDEASEPAGRLLGMLDQKIVLWLPSYHKATYSFSQPGVTGGMSVTATGWFAPETGGRVTRSLQVTELSGTIRVQETMTPSSGKFSYEVRVQYLPGQVSTFKGAVTFDGVRYQHSCGW